MKHNQDVCYVTYLDRSSPRFRVLCNGNIVASCKTRYNELFGLCEKHTKRFLEISDNGIVRGLKLVYQLQITGVNL